MMETNKLSATSLAPGGDDAMAYQAFHSYQWDLDKDFLGGLVLALGGYHALAQTASQADIVMHSRLFYYARVRSVTVPYAGYRQWLRDQYLSNPDATRIWEWHLLRTMCAHRDKLVAAGAATSTATASSLEQEMWMRDLLQTAPSPASDVAAPAWMNAAPKADLFVDKSHTTENAGGDQVPYPVQFAAIIEAVQSGKPIEGILEIPDTTARNPTTTPFGQMARPAKPWETAQMGQSQYAPANGGVLEQAHVDLSFPEQEENPVVSAEAKS